MRSFCYSSWSFATEFTWRSLHHTQWRFWLCMICVFYLVTPTMEGAIIAGSLGYYALRGLDLASSLYEIAKQRWLA